MKQVSACDEADICQVFQRRRGAILRELGHTGVAGYTQDSSDLYPCSLAIIFKLYTFKYIVLVGVVGFFLNLLFSLDFNHC